MAVMLQQIAPQSAAQLLRNWGFVSHADLPDGPGESWLAIAIRPRPTLQHFDAERAEYWTTVAGRGVARALDRTTPLPLSAAFSWGPIRVVDRLQVRNEWVAFGGSLNAAEVDGNLVCVFASDAPILRRGGHSQGWDRGAANLAAFFGRLKVAVDYVPGFEAQVAAATPRVRFAAFVADLAARFRASRRMTDTWPALWGLIATEEARLRRAEADTWAAGLELGRAAGLLPSEGFAPPPEHGAATPRRVLQPGRRA
jgi:hypothetical protein